MKKYIEKIFKFGKDQNLVGVTTEPTNCMDICHKPAVILLNAGLIHRVGLQRMNADIARSLSSMGVFAFRVDLYGVGDSTSNNDSLSFRQRAFNDIRQSMDFISLKYNINEFILIGHCAGADNAHFVTIADSRVIGAVFIDGFGYPTLEFRLKDYGGESKINLLKWSKVILRKIIDLSFGLPARKTFFELYGRKWPTHENAKSDIKKIIERDANLLYVYSGGVPVYYNYKNQFRDMFRDIDLNGQVCIEYVKEADHNLSLLGPRDKIMKIIYNWISYKFSKCSSK